MLRVSVSPWLTSRVSSPHESSRSSAVGRDGGARVRARRLRAEGGGEGAAGAATADGAAAGVNVAGIASSARPSACARIARPDSCFEPNRLDGKTLIHNFGHGGSGMSLSWGTASMATDMALAHTRAQGRGDGLRRRRPDLRARAAAPRLRRHDLRRDRAARYDLEHVAGRLHADVRSRRLPRCARRNGTRSSAQAVRIAYRRLQLLVGPKYGITWIKQYAPTDNEPAGRGRRIRCCRRICRAARDPRPANIRSRRNTAIERDRDAHRAVDLSRRVDERLPAVGRQGGDPQVRDAARRRRA